MELSFACDNSADASLLAQELEETLRAQGISPNAISLKPASPENMDIGSWSGLPSNGQGRRWKLPAPFSPSPNASMTLPTNMASK